MLIHASNPATDEPQCSAMFGDVSADWGNVTCVDCLRYIPPEYACVTCGKAPGIGCHCAQLNETLRRLPKRSG